MFKTLNKWRKNLFNGFRQGFFFSRIAFIFMLLGLGVRIAWFFYTISYPVLSFLFIIFDLFVGVYLLKQFRSGKLAVRKTILWHFSRIIAVIFLLCFGWYGFGMWYSWLHPILTHLVGSDTVIMAKISEEKSAAFYVFEAVVCLCSAILGVVVSTVVAGATYFFVERGLCGGNVVPKDEQIEEHVVLEEAPAAVANVLIKHAVPEEAKAAVVKVLIENAVPEEAGVGAFTVHKIETGIGVDNYISGSRVINGQGVAQRFELPSPMSVLREKQSVAYETWFRDSDLLEKMLPNKGLLLSNRFQLETQLQGLQSKLKIANENCSHARDSLAFLDEDETSVEFLEGRNAVNKSKKDIQDVELEILAVQNLIDDVLAQLADLAALEASVKSSLTFYRGGERTDAATLHITKLLNLQLERLNAYDRCVSANAQDGLARQDWVDAKKLLKATKVRVEAAAQAQVENGLGHQVNLYLDENGNYDLTEHRRVIGIAVKEIVAESVEISTAAANCKTCEMEAAESALDKAAARLELKSAEARLEAFEPTTYVDRGGKWLLQWCTGDW